MNTFFYKSKLREKRKYLFSFLFFSPSQRKLEEIALILNLDFIGKCFYHLTSFLQVLSTSIYYFYVTKEGEMSICMHMTMPFSLKVTGSIVFNFTRRKCIQDSCDVGRKVRNYPTALSLMRSSFLSNSESLHDVIHTSYCLAFFQKNHCNSSLSLE